MEILTTRILRFRDPKADPNEAVVTVFKPVAEDDTWRVSFICSPPLRQRMRGTVALDISLALTYALTIIRALLQGGELLDKLHWQGRADCGLVTRVVRPPEWLPPEIPPPEENPGNLEILSSSMAALPGEAGVETMQPLTIFMPKQAEDGHWRCGVALGAPRSAPIHYGEGDDFIEAFLDAAALARVLWESNVPKGWKSQADLAVKYLPFKLGKSFYMDHDSNEATDSQTDGSGSNPNPIPISAT